MGLSFPPYSRNIEIYTKSYVNNTSTYELIFCNHDRSPLSLTICSPSTNDGSYYNKLNYNGVSSYSVFLSMNPGEKATVNVSIMLSGDNGYKLVLSAPANSYYSAINSKLATFCEGIGN